MVGEKRVVYGQHRPKNKYAVASTGSKEQGCNKVEKKLDALATPDSAPSGLSGIPDKLLVMSETVMNGSVEAFFQRRGLAAISCSVCVALSEAGCRQARRKTELRLASFKLGRGLRYITKMCRQNDDHAR